MNSRRIQRISQEVKVISNLLLDGIKDPRISPMTSITSVRYLMIYLMQIYMFQCLEMRQKKILL